MWNASASPSTIRSSPLTMNGTRQRNTRSERRDGDGLAPGRSAERTKCPERDVAELAIVRDEDQQADRCLRERADRESCQQKSGDRGAALARREAVERWWSAARRKKRRSAMPRMAARSRSRPGNGRRARWWLRRRARRPRIRRPNRIGQRIAKQALHDGAGRRQHCANHAGHGDARQPDRPQYQTVTRDQGRIAGDKAGGGQQPRAVECRRRRWWRPRPSP